MIADIPKSEIASLNNP